MTFEDWLKKYFRIALKLPQIEEQIRQIVKSSKPGTIYKCFFNGIPLLAPVELLRMYPQCLRLRPDRFKFFTSTLNSQLLQQSTYHEQAGIQFVELGYSSQWISWIEQKLTYFVETEQSSWLCDKIKPGDIVLDVGAAFGVVSITLSKALKDRGCVYAFEPSKTARHFLQAILDLNQISNVKIVATAVSEASGFADFVEYIYDDRLPWISDVSALALDSNSQKELNHLRYSVDVTTIDDYVMAAGIVPKAIKMDIEGFESYALRGGQHTLKQFKPYLCIDIHQDVKTRKSSQLEIEPYLSSLNYKCYTKGHALYALPTTARFTD